MPDALKYLLEAAVGFALFMALLVVFVVDRFWLSDGAAPSANTLENVKIHEDKSKYRDLKRLKLAVTPTAEDTIDPIKKITQKWDDMGKLLDEMGDGYRYDRITMRDAINLKKLSEYDVVFLTCAEGAEEELKEVLPAYVAQGGILYASDWRYKAVARAFPDMVVPVLQGEGAEQQLEGELVDPGLREHLKVKSIHLNFDMPEWKTAAFGGPRVQVLIKGKYKKNQSNQFAEAPLMVKFSVGKGTVVFTSFHNERQNSRTEKLLLQYLVFSLVTAGIDAEVNTQMDQGGFTPQRSNLLSTPADQSITKEYKNEHIGTLRFALGFRNEGAELRFNIKAPDGKHFTWQGNSTVALEVPNAMPGVWTYTVTARRLPYANFPFTVTVGEKKQSPA